MVTRKLHFGMLLAAVLVLPLSLPGAAAHAQTSAPSSVDANNPLAEFKAFNLHNYYVTSLTEADNQNANTFWARYAQPFGKWLVRGSLEDSGRMTVAVSRDGISVNVFGICTSTDL